MESAERHSVQPAARGWENSMVDPKCRNSSVASKYGLSVTLIRGDSAPHRGPCRTFPGGTYATLGSGVKPKAK